MIENKDIYSNVKKFVNSPVWTKPRFMPACGIELMCYIECKTKLFDVRFGGLMPVTNVQESSTS